MATKQGFYPRVHLYDDLTISVFHFHSPFPVSISTVSNCPLITQDKCTCAKIESGSNFREMIEI